MQDLFLRRRGRRRTLVVVAAGFAALVCALAALLPRIAGAAAGYVYGYPLVIIDLTRAGFARQPGGENALHRLRRFPDADFKRIVRPNVDTLYTTAFIDMALGPWVFEMAPDPERYEVMQFMDAWSNVFASLGARTTGREGGAFLLAGPGWQGRAPAGLTLLRAPTRIVWMIGRTQTDGVADYALVHRLQDGLRLRSLADWQAGRPEAAEQPLAADPVPPVEQMRELGATAFFTRLAGLMADNPPAAADAAVVARLARIGVAPGRPPDWGPLDRAAASLGRWIADVVITRGLQHRGELVRGWSTPPALLGRYGAEYGVRAGVARVGLGANLPADAVYPQAQVDDQGQALDGSRRYRLHFDKGGLPPVNAFWSVTAYAEDDFFIANPIDRYALGDRDPLVFNADGSLDLLIQATKPAVPANWLPVKAGESFSIMARLYWPKPEVLDGHWRMPGIQRLD